MPLLRPSRLDNLRLVNVFGKINGKMEKLKNVKRARKHRERGFSFAIMPVLQLEIPKFNHLRDGQCVDKNFSFGDYKSMHLEGSHGKCGHGNKTRRSGRTGSL